MVKKSTKSKTPMVGTTPMVINPWLNISWQDTVADCDKKVIHPLFCAQNGINISTLPCPYSGDPKSKVYVLGLNPATGIGIPYFWDDKAYEKEIQADLQHKLNDFLWLRPIITKKKRIWHDGSMWWYDRTEELRKAVGKNDLDIFSLEYFPYHTVNSFKFPALPSDEYRNYLLEKAMNEEKLIIIMRSVNLWYSISGSPSGIPLGDKLKNYSNKIILKNPQNICLTSGNMNKCCWNELVKILK